MCVYNGATMPAKTTAQMTREECIAWLIANDRNGCYSDEDCIAEGLQPLTHAEALQLIRSSLDD
jgi:hypothetical protein